VVSELAERSRAPSTQVEDPRLLVSVGAHAGKERERHPTQALLGLSPVYLLPSCLLSMIPCE
jgi:hypothetical protein